MTLFDKQEILTWNIVGKTTAIMSNVPSVTGEYLVISAQKKNGSVKTMREVAYFDGSRFLSKFYPDKDDAVLDVVAWCNLPGEAIVNRCYLDTLGRVMVNQK